DLFVRSLNRPFCGGFLKAREGWLRHQGQIKHLVETCRQILGERSSDLQSQVAPAAGDAIALIFAGDIKSSDESHFFIADEQLAMIPNAKAAEESCVEAACFASRRA